MSNADMPGPATPLPDALGRRTGTVTVTPFFFGAYLDARIASAQAALRGAPAGPAAAGA